MNEFLKAVCITTTLIASMSVRAQETGHKVLTIENLTYPEKSMLVECEDVKCELMKFTVNPGSRSESISLVDMDSVKQRASDERERGSSTTFYGGTKDMSKRASKKYKEAYYGDAVGNSLLTGVIALAETIVLPVNIIENLFDKGAAAVRKDKKGAKKVFANINSNLNNVFVKHKFFEQMRRYVTSYPEALSEEDYNLLLSFRTNKFKNCSIAASSRSIYKTSILIDGSNSRDELNRTYGSDESDLVFSLIALETSGKCIRK